MRNRLRTILTMSALTAGLSMTAAAQSLVTTVALPTGALGVAVNPITNTIYAVEPGTGTTASLAVINGKENTLTTQIDVPLGATYATVDYLTNRIFVAGCNFNLNPTPCSVTAINGTTNQIISTLQLTTTPGLGLSGIVSNPLTGLVYVANANDNVVNILSASENKAIGSISLNGNAPAAIAINPLLNLMYVPYGTNQTAVVDLSLKKILTTTSYGYATVGAAANYLTGRVYVTDQETGPSTTGVLSVAGKVLSSITVSDYPLGVDVDSFTNKIFVVSVLDGNVEEISGSTNTVTGTVPVIQGALFTAVNPATQKVYVSGSAGITVVAE